MQGYKFPWDTIQALEVALIRTYCLPSISKLLNKTRAFIHRAQKRYEDTSIMLTEIVKWGFESERGREALQKINSIHRRFQIDNADFFYVLSTLIYEPIHWNQRFGWQLMCENEKLVTFYFWLQVGEATHDLFISWFPKWMEKPLKPITYTLLDDTILDAFGF